MSGLLTNASQQHLNILTLSKEVLGTTVCSGTTERTIIRCLNKALAATLSTYATACGWHCETKQGNLFDYVYVAVYHNH